MKTQLSLLAIGTFFLHSTVITPAQLTEKKLTSEVKESVVSATPAFNSFRTHRQGKLGVTSTWDLSSESGIMHYELMRTYEDPTDPYANWEMVALTPVSNARSYKFTDSNVFPGYISYCVMAKMTSGGEVISPVSTIRIVSH
ncbi:MAG: hypothetical protein ABIP79_06810 [Chitinophagaceae bacterium]